MCSVARKACGPPSGMISYWLPRLTHCMHLASIMRFMLFQCREFTMNATGTEMPSSANLIPMLHGNVLEYTHYPMAIMA